MQHCKQQLQGLVNTSPAWQQAVSNLLDDLQTPAQPHGNIPDNMAKALEHDCKTAGADVPGTVVVAVVRAHQTVVHQPALRGHAPRPDHALRRCMSRTTYLKYHVSLDEGTKKPYGSESSSHAHFLDPEDWSSSFSDARVMTQPAENLRGLTGRPDAATWWTFAHIPLPGKALAYMSQLALGEVEIEQAYRDGMAVVVEVPVEAFGEEFYKPCAVDAFTENTPFRPNLSEDPYGWTHPIQSGLSPLPEVIAKSVPYHDLGDANTLVTLTLLPYP